VEHQLSAEKQQPNFQKELASARSELLSQTKHAQELERQSDRKALELEQMHKQHAALEKAHSILVQQDQKNLQVLAVLQERCEHAKKTIAERDQNLTNSTYQLAKLEKEAAILKDQNTSLKQTLNKAHDKIEVLRSEKLFLAQEKYELEGYMRQLKNTSKKTSETVCLKS
jgi:hypothetical protein